MIIFLENELLDVDPKEIEPHKMSHSINFLKGRKYSLRRIIKILERRRCYENKKKISQNNNNL